MNKIKRVMFAEECKLCDRTFFGWTEKQLKNILDQHKKKCEKNNKDKKHD